MVDQLVHGERRDAGGPVSGREAQAVGTAAICQVDFRSWPAFKDLLAKRDQGLSTKYGCSELWREVGRHVSGLMWLVGLDRHPLCSGPVSCAACARGRVQNLRTASVGVPCSSRRGHRSHPGHHSPSRNPSRARGSRPKRQLLPRLVRRLLHPPWLECPRRRLPLRLQTLPL